MTDFLAAQAPIMTPKILMLAYNRCRKIECRTALGSIPAFLEGIYCGVITRPNRPSAAQR
jgi:hypothetical protein